MNKREAQRPTPGVSKGRNSVWSCFLQLPMFLGLTWGDDIVTYMSLPSLAPHPCSQPGLCGCFVGLCQPGLGRGIAPSHLCFLPQVQYHLSGEDPPGAEGSEASASH